MKRTRLVAWATLLAAFGCHTPPPASPQGAAAGKPAGAEIALARTDAIWALPADTELLIAAGNLAAIVAATGTHDAMRSRREWYENAVAEVVQATGHNLLDPANFSAIGLDPDGVWGLAILDSDAESIALFAPVIDADKLKTALYRTAANIDKKLEASVVGDAVIIVPEKAGDDLALAISGDIAFFIFIDNGDGRDAHDVAAALAARPPGESLAASDDYQRVTGKLALGSVLAGYVAPAFFVAALEVPANTVGAGAFGAEIKAAAVRAEAFVDVPPGSPLSGLLDGTHDYSTLLGSAGDLVVGARIDFDAFLRLDDADEVLADATEKLGVDVKREIATGLAVTAEDGHLKATPIGTPAAEATDTRMVDIFSKPGSAAIVIKPGLLGWLVGTGSAGMGYAVGSSPSANPSPEERALEQQLAELKKKVVAERERRDEQEAKAVTSLFDKLGTIAVRINVEDDGLRLSGGQFFSQPIPAAVTGAVADVASIDRMSDGSWHRMDEIWTEMREVRAKLARARASKNRVGGLIGTGTGGGGKGYGTIGLGRLGTISQGSGSASGVGMKRGQVRIGAAQSQGPLSKDIIRRYIRRRLSHIRYCYEKQLVKHPKLAARITMEFTIASTGLVGQARAHIKGASNPPTRAVGTCIEKVFRGLRFPKPDRGGVVKVRYPFIFKTP